VIAQDTGGRGPRGEKAVANYDEDSLTMAVEASLACLENYSEAWGSSLAPSKIEGVIFASTSAPFREKQSSSILCSVLEASRSALVADLHGSLRYGLTGLEIASKLLKERPPETNVLVVASEKRKAEPGSSEDYSFGDGAGALLLGQRNLLASLESRFSVSANFLHFWRREEDEYVRSGDSRFVENHGYLSLMAEAIRGLLKETGLKVTDISKLVAYTPEPRLGQQLARRLGFNPETQLANTFNNSVGDTGTAQVFLGLSAALCQARPGERIAVAGYGDGAEVLLLKATEEILKIEACQKIEAYLKRGRPLKSYMKYLHFRDITGESSYDAFSSLALLWREEKQNLRLYGAKCQRCGVIHFPRRRVCDKCGAKDEMEDFKLRRRGRIYTYTNDYVYLNPDPPETLAVIDLDGGGRFYGQVTDINPKDVTIGLEVELGFRKLHDGQGLPNYFWKARPTIGRE
jgi:3-hydroxy-3-methylglutaryl CoA synthase